MQIGQFIVIYTVIWWLVFFIALPIGIEIDPNPQIGNAKSAPKKPRILLKMLIATILSAILSLICAYYINKFLNSEAFIRYLNS